MKKKRNLKPSIQAYRYADDFIDWCAELYPTCKEKAYATFESFLVIQQIILYGKLYSARNTGVINKVTW